MSRWPVAIGLLGSFFIFVGCSTDTMQSRQVSVEVLPAQNVILSKPVVDKSGERFEITGTVQRQPGYSGMLFGHVNIEIVDHDGYLHDSFPAALTPRSIPSFGNQTSSYDLYIQAEIPAGSTVRVSYSDDSKPTTQPGTGMPGVFMDRPKPMSGSRY